VEDVFRPHVGVKAKVKLCMHCRAVVDAAKAAAAFNDQQNEALGRAIAAGRAAIAERDAAERERDAMATAVGDPFYGLDADDPGRVAKDAALRRCAALSGPPRKACLDGILGATVSMPDPTVLDGSRTIEARVPNAATDPRGVLPDPRRPYKPPPPQVRGEDVDALQPPFTRTAAAAAAVELASSREAVGGAIIMAEVGDGAGAGAGVLPNSIMPAPPAPPPEAAAGQSLTLASMEICVNVGSREFIFSLFRGVVGTQGDVECVPVDTL